MATQTEVSAMWRAIELAARGATTTRPNPDVGAVVLDGRGVVVGEGWHERAGGPHAEVVAIRAAGAAAAGGTLVVTLEPCSQVGRTGPCTEEIRRASVARVVYAVDDPTRAGGGADALRAAGVVVEGDVLAAEATRVNARWLTSVRRERPFVVWKVASTLDGRVAAADGTSRWISGAESRADSHRLRAACDTIMVGIGTVLCDDPHLTVRAGSGDVQGEQPLRVVVDSIGRTPADARVRDTAAETWIATAAEVGGGADGGVDLPALLHALHERGRQSVLLEGGPTLASGFWRNRLVDRVVVYVAPLLLGAGVPVLAGAGITTLAEAAELELTDVRRVGPDIRITAETRERQA